MFALVGAYLMSFLKGAYAISGCGLPLEVTLKSEQVKNVSNMSLLVEVSC